MRIKCRLSRKRDRKLGRICCCFFPECGIREWFVPGQSLSLKRWYFCDNLLRGKHTGVFDFLLNRPPAKDTPLITAKSWCHLNAFCSLDSVELIFVAGIPAPDSPFAPETRLYSSTAVFAYEVVSLPVEQFTRCLWLFRHGILGCNPRKSRARQKSLQGLHLS